MTTPKPDIASFRPDLPLLLTPAPNGGWIVEQTGTPGIGVHAVCLGAYSDSDAMLSALSSAFKSQDAS